MPGPGFHAEPPLTIERPSGPAAPTRGDAADLGWAPRPACSTPAGGRVVPGGPLEGVRVLSFGAFIAGATVGCLLAELGADVVKIEARSHPEVLRTPAYAIGRTFTEPSGVPNTLMYASFNRSVRNLSLEMGTEDGRALFRRLAAGVDVVIENFGTGVLDRWGCGFDALLEMNPRVVLTSLSGYGRTGPRAAHLAYASNISSFAALTYAWGGHSHTTHSDYIAGQHAAVATLAALRQAHATGRGVHVDVAQTEAMTAVMPGLLLDALVNRRNVPPPANRVAGSLLSGAYRALGYDAWLAIELEDLGDWNKACSVVGRGDLAITAAAAGRRNDLDAAIAEWCARRPSHTGAHLLQRAGVAAGVVQTAEDVCRDPQLRSRGYFVELDQPDLGRYEHWANPYRFSVTRPGPSRAAPRLGGHTKALLREWLQIADEEIDSLITSGVVFQG
jgi:crotonobetainyl-CoA:carnitine CoA-transferase CaiB-like acyl-CoA transferase